MKKADCQNNKPQTPIAGAHVTLCLIWGLFARVG